MSSSTNGMVVAPLLKTREDSFFVLATRGAYTTQEMNEKEKARLEEENDKTRRAINAVALNDLYGDSPHIEGKQVEVLQIQMLNEYATTAVLEVRYKN